MDFPAFLFKDRSLVRHGAEGLEAYLLSNELYGPPSYEGGLDLASRLTVGTLLLAGARLAILADGQDDLLDADLARIKGTREAWRSHWQKKAARELDARLSLWSEFLDGWLGSPAGRKDAYAIGARNRAIIHLLLQNTGTIAQAQLDWISGCDRRLLASTVEGAFVWEVELADNFPQPDWWFLYRSRTR